VKVVVSVGEDLAAAGLDAARLAKVAVIFLGTHSGATSAAAAVVLPTRTVFEKSGTFINQQFRLQKFHPAVPGPVGAIDDLEALARLVTAGGGPQLPRDVRAVWPDLAAEIPALAGLDFASIPATGKLLDAAPWAELSFVEGENLHFKPAADKAASAR